MENNETDTSQFSQTAPQQDFTDNTQTQVAEDPNMLSQQNLVDNNFSSDPYNNYPPVTPVDTMTPSPTSKGKIIFIILVFIGVLLIAGGATYYFLVYRPNAQKAQQEAEKMAQEEAQKNEQEQQQQTETTTDSDIETDPFVTQVEGATQETSINQVEEDLNELDYEGILVPDENDIETDEFK